MTPEGAWGKARMRAMAWDAILSMSGTPGARFADCDEAGNPVPGTEWVAAMPSPADPMWRPEGEPRARYVGEFTPQHRARLYSWLMRRAPSICSLVANMAHAPTLGWDDGLEVAHEEYVEAVCSNPWGWLAEQPFMRALAALLIGDGNAAVVLSWEDQAAANASRLRRARVPVSALWLGQPLEGEA